MSRNERTFAQAGFLVAGGIMWLSLVWSQDRSSSDEGMPSGPEIHSPGAGQSSAPGTLPPHPKDRIPESSPSPMNMEPKESSVVENIGPNEFQRSLMEAEGTSSVSPSTAPSVPREYVIERGDTLWDICQKLLGNPWYWPKLWSLNQYIVNPHLIYPGDRLVFYMGSETAPPRLDILSAGEEPVQGPTGAPVLSEPKEIPSEIPMEKEPVRTTEVKLKAVTFVSEKAIKTSGYVSHSGEPKMLLSEGDHVYLSFTKTQEVSVGDRFHVVEKIKKVKDPDSGMGRTLGWLVRKKAIVKILCLHPDIVEGQIVSAEESVVRKDRVIPFQDPVRRVQPHDTTQKIQGRIAESDHQQYLIGNSDFVFLNRGRRHGIEEGLRMAVVRRGDGLFPENDKSLPFVIFGKVLVVETNDRTATAYVYDAKDALAVGDKVITPMPMCGSGTGAACK